MQNILIIQRHSPFNQATGRESLDLILALAAVEHKVTVLFTGDAIYQLLPADTAASLLLKPYNRGFKLFGLYDIEQVYVCQQSMIERNIPVNVLPAGMQLASADVIRQLLSQQQHLISC
ncbi:sulfurtransferase complex subunit TusC [Chromatiaceae bacterium AAb-1]|nr:sulfurtransferase complex subunit TusC [Chromatiaceae bacterium AAb-1]